MLRNSVVAVCAVGVLLSGCVSTDFSQLAVGQAPATPDSGADCSASSPEVHAFLESPAVTADSIAAVGRDMPDELQNSKVVSAILRLSERQAQQGSIQARRVQARSRMAVEQLRSASERAAEIKADRAALDAAAPPPPPLSGDDFKAFATLIASHVVRSTPASEDAAKAPFWSNLSTYYKAYYKGQFVDYFGTKYAQPTINSSISDQEIANTVVVFIEYVFDQAAQTPVWSPGDTGHVTGDTTLKSTKITNVMVDVTTLKWATGMVVTDDAKDLPHGTTISAIDVPGHTLTLSAAATASTSGAKLTVHTTTYYPGANTNEPYLLTLAPDRLKVISQDEWDVGCGMTIPKAEAMAYLAHAFSSAASSDTGLAMGSVGGLEGGFLVLGKFNLGDNKALTALVEAIVTDLVARSTIQATYPVLSAISFAPGTPSHTMTGAFISPLAPRPPGSDSGN